MGDDEGVEGDDVATGNKRIDVDLCDEIGEVGGQDGKQRYDVGEAIDVDGGDPPIAVEQAPDLQPVEQSACGGATERRKRGAPVVDQFDQHAARSDDDDRTELRVVDHAERQFDPAFGHGRDQRARAQPARQVAISLEQGLVIGEVEPHAAVVRLVQDA